MEKHELIECPRCGVFFECKQGSILICHCSKVKLSREQIAYLAENWDGCLCHDCLVSVKDDWENKSQAKKSIQLV